MTEKESFINEDSKMVLFFLFIDLIISAHSAAVDTKNINIDDALYEDHFPQTHICDIKIYWPTKKKDVEIKVRVLQIHDD